MALGFSISTAVSQVISATTFKAFCFLQTAARDALLEAGVTPYNGRTYEHLIGTKIGGSTFDSRGRRHSAADFLTFAEPQNITVFLWANVQQLLFANSSSSSGESSIVDHKISVSVSDGQNY